MAEQAFGAHGKDERQEGLVGHGAIDAQFEGGFVILVIGHQVAQDRVRFQDLEHFAGHIGAEALNDIVFYQGPLGMGAGQDEHAVTQAEKLCFLAAHDIEQAFVISRRAQARNDLHLELVGGSIDQMGGDVLQAGRTGLIGRFHPAGARTNHAGEQNGQVRAVEIALHDRQQGLLERQNAEVSQADVGGVLGDDLAIGAEEEQAEIGGAPVSGDQGRRRIGHMINLHGIRQLRGGFSITRTPYPPEFYRRYVPAFRRYYSPCPAFTLSGTFIL